MDDVGDLESRAVHLQVVFDGIGRLAPQAVAAAAPVQPLIERAIGGGWCVAVHHRLTVVRHPLAIVKVLVRIVAARTPKEARAGQSGIVEEPVPERDSIGVFGESVGGAVGNALRPQLQGLVELGRGEADAGSSVAATGGRAHRPVGPIVEPDGQGRWQAARATMAGSRNGTVRSKAVLRRAVRSVYIARRHVTRDSAVGVESVPIGVGRRPPSLVA